MSQTEIENLVVKLTADVQAYVKGFQQAQAQTIETTKHIENATEKVKGFTESVVQFGQVALAGLAGVGVARWFKEVFDLAGSTEQQFIGLSAAIRSNTDDVDNTLEAYKRFAEGMFEVTGTSKRTTLALLQMDEMQGLTAKRAMETARQAIALGAASGMEPRSLISRLNMAQTGSGAQMLHRVPGLQHITDEAQLVEKANRMMAVGMEVSKAQMQSATGMVKKLSEELEEVKKQFGKLLLEALKPGIELLTKTVQWFKDLDERTKLVILSLAGMTTGIVALVNGLKLLNAATSILFSGTGGLLTVMLPIAAAAALWIEHLGGVAKTWDLVKSKAQQFWDWIKPVAQGVWNSIRAGALITANAILLVWESLKTYFEPLKELLVAGWQKVGEAASWAADKIGSMWAPLEVATASYAATLATLGAALYWGIPKSLEELLPISLRVFQTLSSDAMQVLPAIVDSVKVAVTEAMAAIRSAWSTAGSVLASIATWFSGLPAKIQVAANWIADFIQTLPPLIHQAAVDMSELTGVLEIVAVAFRKINEQFGGLSRGVAIAGIVGTVLISLITGFSRISFIVGGISTGFAVLGDKFIPVVVTWLAWLAWAGPKMSFIVGLITLMAARTDLVWQALSKVKEFFSWIANNNEWVTNIANKLSEFFRWIGTSIGPAMRAVGEFYTAFGRAATEAFDMIQQAASEAFGFIQAVAGEVFSAASQVVANFNWNLQNTVMVIAGAVGVVAAMATFLLAWGVAAKVVSVAMAYLAVVMLPVKLQMMALSLVSTILNTLYVFTGVKLLLLAAAYVVATAASLFYKVATVALTIVKMAFLIVLVAVTVALLALAAAITGVVVVAFIAAAGAVMALVDVIKNLTLFSGAADTFKHWKDIFGGLSKAIQVDMGVAWRYVQDAMHLAGEEVKAYWPPVWARIKEGFSLLWDVVSSTFKMKMLDATSTLVGVFSRDQQTAMLKEYWNQNDINYKAREGLRKMAKEPLDLGKITSPEMEAAKAKMEGTIANVEELAKLKKAADEEADKAAKKHKEELDTATKLNNLTQQHVELKKAELILANSAEALYRIQAYRTSQQAALEARAAQMRKDALDKGPEKGAAQRLYEIGLEADRRREDVRRAEIPAMTMKEVAKRFEETTKEMSNLYSNPTIDNPAAHARLSKEQEALWEKIKTSPEYKAANPKKDTSKDIVNSILAEGKVPSQEANKESFWGEISTLLRDIRDNAKENSKKPTLEVKPAGLK